MQLSISYVEIGNYLSVHHHREIKLAYVTEKEMRVSFSPHQLMPDISVNIKIKNVSDEKIILEYNGNMAVNLLLPSYIKEKNYLKIFSDSREIHILPMFVKGAEKIFGHLSLTDARLDESGVNLSLLIL